MRKGYHLSIESILNGYLFREKMVYKRVMGKDSWTEPPRINICWVPPPPVAAVVAVAGIYFLRFKTSCVILTRASLWGDGDNLLISLTASLAYWLANVYERAIPSLWKKKSNNKKVTGPREKLLLNQISWHSWQMMFKTTLVAHKNLTSDMRTTVPINHIK